MAASPAIETGAIISGIRQRLLFLAGPAAQGLHWRLGSRVLGPADRPLPWHPVPGHHRLQLVDEQSRIVDEVRF